MKKIDEEVRSFLNAWDIYRDEEIAEVVQFFEGRGTRAAATKPTSADIGKLTVYEFSAFEDGKRQQYVLLDEARSLLATKPAAPEGFVLVPEAASADEIVSRLYRRFKECGKRDFGPDDVTWCEVKADINAILAAADPAAPAAQDQAKAEPVLYAAAKDFPLAPGDEIMCSVKELAPDDIPLYRVPVVQEQAKAEPVGYVKESELVELADNRVAGMGMMIHKKASEGKVALYRVPVASADAVTEAREQVLEDAALVVKAEDCVMVPRRDLGMMNLVLEQTRGKLAQADAYIEQLESDRAIEVLASNAGAAPGMPEGFTLAPIKATPEMIEAYNNVPCGFAGSPAHGSHVWAAMLDAAPSNTSPVGAHDD